MEIEGTSANHIMFFTPIYYAIDKGFVPKTN